MKLYQTKQFWIVVGIIAAIALIIFFIANKPPEIKEGTVKFKDSEGNVVEFNPKPYTDDLQANIYAWNEEVPLRDTTLYENLYNLSDTEFKLVAQDWNKRYYAKDKETLRMAIFKEYFLGEIGDKLQNRFKNLNIS